MRIAVFVASLVVLLALALAVQPPAPIAGQTMPPVVTSVPPLTPYPTSTPGGCTDSYCFPWPTPRPTIDPDAPIGPAQPDPGTGIWHYSFLPKIGRR